MHDEQMNKNLQKEKLLSKRSRVTNTICFYIKT